MSLRLRLSLLAAEPPGATFPASGWKRDFKGVSAEVDTNEHCFTLLCIASKREPL
ncbi:MAG: hypothetical protein V7L27_15365 [Nostoc sp.]|uniref:hypothetical protein n=1 Tax=Nostoc sp. TaxID=1180 RepID=UPI002FF534CE